MKTGIKYKDKLIMDSRFPLVKPKRCAEGLDVGCKRKRSQRFPSLNLFKESKTNEINITEGGKKKLNVHHVLGTILHLTVTTTCGGNDYYSHFTDKNTRCSSG